MSKNPKPPTPQQRAEAVRQVVEGRRTELRRTIASGDVQGMHEAAESLDEAEAVQQQTQQKES